MLKENAVRQAAHYDQKYRSDLERYLFKEIGFGEHLQSIHWQILFGRYLSDVRGRRVLDIGCGTGWTSLLLAQRGAQVTAVDISAREIEILCCNAAHYGLKDRICALAGDITQMGLAAESFEMCVGGSILHHLEPNEEVAILQEIHRLLAPGGMAVFVEPAVNSKLLDGLRYLVPVPGRPARWSRRWDNYKRHDPHPDRDISSRHFRRVGRELFERADVEAMGVFNRIERLTRYRGKAWIHRLDYAVTRLLPRPLREPFCRAQIIRYWKASATA